MKLPQACVDMILGAEGKALATVDGLNPHVVPVSSVKVIDDKVVLVNYFFNQTLKNIEANNVVALSAWKGLSGFQVKAVADYQTEGEIFETIKSWIREILPDRLVKGVLVLTPTEVFDVSAGENAGTKVA